MAGMKKRLASFTPSFKSLKWYEWIMAAVMILIAANSLFYAFLSPSSSSNPPWLTIINFISAVCGIICIFFTAKAHISNFSFSIINTVTYIVYLGYWRILGTMFLELFVYLPIEILSWIAWVRHKDTEDTRRTLARKIKPWQMGIVALIISAAAFGYHSVLVMLGGTVVWLDAFTLSIGIAAIILEMLRYREQYIWWLITDFIAVAMYITHFDPVYLTKKSIYLIMAVVGLVNWFKLSRHNPENE